MDTSQLFKAGKLSEAIDAQLPVVKARPSDHGQRLFLFELLVFAGDLDRAQRQIDAIDHGQPEIDAAVLDYRNLLDAERLRRQVFGQKAQPGLFATAPEHVRTRLLGLAKLSDGSLAEAAELFQQANAAPVRVKGKLNGKPFDDLRDGDDRFGSVLEVMTRGKYYWVPLEQVATLTMNAPRFPRDQLWIPAHLEMAEGDTGSVFVPALYPGTERETDPQLKLGRMTDWRGNALVIGVGLKTFLMGEEAVGILDWRKLEMALA